jgi:3-hydroxyisobutyrate dehydrogenase
MAKVAWIGLGVMGSPMAGHIARKTGHQLTVYNRTAAKAVAWQQEYGHAISAAPMAAAEDADVVLSCVGNDDDLAAVMLGPTGAFASLKPGAIVIDHTTASADIARRLADAAHQRGATFFDAPVSGGQKGAVDGQLSVMVGGDADRFADAKAVIDCYAKACRLMGPSGSGQLTKMVNQIAIAGLIQSLSEALHFAECAGLDPAAVLAVIGKGAAQSWQMDNRWPTMARREFDFGFAVDWMRKDLAICLAEARRNGAQLPVAALIEQFYAQIQQQGGGRMDTSSLITRLLPPRKG